MDLPKPSISFQPYLLRAMYEWIADNGFTPHIDVDTKWKGVVVPKKFIDEGKVILNISSLAVQNLRIGNDAAEFKTKFGNMIYHIYLPIGSIRSIFARENNCGTIFSPELRAQQVALDGGPAMTPPKPSKAKPKLRVITSKKKSKKETGNKNSNPEDKD